MDFFSIFSVTPIQGAAAFFAAMLLGISRMGLSSIAMLTVPMLALAFGGRVSVGLVLPIALSADVAGVITYLPHVKIKPLLRVVPGSLVGIALGAWLGAMIPDALFKQIIGVVVLLSLAMQAYRDWRGNTLTVPQLHLPTAIVVGIVGGFTSMVGNAAGAVMLVYFLSLGLPKNNYIACWGWFFFLTNAVKLIPHILIWKTLSLDTLPTNLLMVPGLILGLLVGRFVVKRIPEKPYRYVLLIGTLAASLLLFF